MIETSVDEIDNICQVVRTAFNSGRTRSVQWRKQQIQQLFKMCLEQENVFASAAHVDFRRPHAETLLYDCGVVSFREQYLTSKTL